MYELILNFDTILFLNMEINPKIESSWLELLNNEFRSDYFKEIKRLLITEKQKGTIIYPKGGLIFNAFNLTPLNKLKVVILGQDPYHGPNQAHGLSFSVLHGIKPPPSLKNIYKELKSDLNITPPEHGNLEKWATQGVLMLNSVLTVSAGKPASHQKIGWQSFTDAVIKNLSLKKEGLVFLLWGKFAQSKSELIDSNKHLILKAAHPSPYSATYGFFGCKHFSKANEYLKSKGSEKIDWSID